MSPTISTSTPTRDDQDTPFTAQWLQEVSAHQPESQRDLFAQAVQYAKPWLTDVRARTGERIDTHCAAMIHILQQLGADVPTQAAALLAYMPEEVGEIAQREKLQAAFGTQVNTLVQGTRSLYRIAKITAQDHDTRALTDQREMKRKMLLAMAVDLRIVLIRLASRLQSLRWFAQSKQPCPLDFARETMELYTPLANRLGIWQIKWEMEDLAFRFLEPDVYKDIARKLEERRVEREAFIKQVVNKLSTALEQAGIQAQVTGRPKHIYSIWNKMRNKQLEFNQLYDLRALRVIVDDERSCYTGLALIHAMWTPLPDEFDDYISRPKPNGYRSLHTVVADEQGRSFEVQIRTREMHHFAEYGMAAHWRYKEAGPRGGEVAASDDEQKIAWMRQLLAWDSTAPKAVPGDSQAAQKEPTRKRPERIYVLTPQARVIELPDGATPIDFAYSLHTDLGHRCRGARVDGQMVPLSTQLETGQTVEIIAAKSGGPSRDWLNPNLGFLASGRSRAKVRSWFNAIELQERISQGQHLVEKELQRLGRTAVNLEQLAHQLGFAKADDLYVAVAKDEYSLRHIEQAFKPQPEEKDHDTPHVADAGRSSVTRTGRSGVLVVGVDSLLTQLARCCRPAPPDKIAGFITKGRGVSIHRSSCPSFKGLIAQQPERAIEVTWGENVSDSVYPVDIHVYAPERAHLLRDITEVFSRLRINVVGVNTQSRRALTHIVFTAEVKNGSEIQKLLTALEEIPGVQAQRR
ncbi:MAG TPA: bifunctional (p)ppGpp synthetase/guanosine-3',5'-bis(diphosphate) 3'-pyrophosphohydrolase [Paenalcaligenes sp.]|nr:bifunctional (p)ppGpp synthetase/guanosine-3',5'-bis(diphosphate) 3'-pyrophosphohydrolase [Paenalcaligenes sp.]